MNETAAVTTLADVLAFLDRAGLRGTRHRDMVSAIKRVCAMAGTMPTCVPAQVSPIRKMLSGILPAAHGISAKSYSNLKSLLAAALQLAGVIDSLGRGRARHDLHWGPLLQAVAENPRMSNGVATFANWCAREGIPPGEVNDMVIQDFRMWLETKTLCPKSRDLVRAVPKIWNEAGAKFDIWPAAQLAIMSFKPTPKHLAWSDLTATFRQDAEAYLALRAKPDLFDERVDAPKRPLAATTLRQHREHLRLAASVLVQSGEEIDSLADLTRPGQFKKILRYYHNKADREPNAFVIGMAKTLIQVARYRHGASTQEFGELKRVASKLPGVPFDLTEKNKNVLRQLESDRVRAKLLFLPEQLLAKVAKDLETGRLRFVEAQVAIATDILLALPLRPQNLSSLTWEQNFREPNGPRGQLLLHIPVGDTKTKKQEIVAEVPEDVARRLRWYRRNVLPALGADMNRHLFVIKGGSRKKQPTLTRQVVDGIARHIGIHMTPHQFRHFGATSYLEQHPEDFETARAILGHAWSKTTLIYAGSSSRRASQAYNQYLLKQREALKLLRSKKMKRKPTCEL